MAGLDFHLIDAEWNRQYMSALELDNVLSLAEELESNLTTIMTVNARHSSAFQILNGYLDVMSQHRNAGLCFVAGNPSYLTEEEHRLDPKSRITRLVRAAGNRLPSAPLFIGSEGLQGLVSELTLEYSAIPFMLLGRSLEDQASSVRSNGSGTAVYCPSDLSRENDQDLLKSFGQYALRRRWVREALRDEGLKISKVRTEISNGRLTDSRAQQVLIDTIHSLALCGHDRTHVRLRELSQKGVRYAALLLPEESGEQNEHLSKLAGEFHGTSQGMMEGSWS